ncbi:MAG: transcription-repair coupling factor [Firmicutes bacterium]|nr:transcription-repair coupling factor [Bacillota bacterium]
MINYAGLSDSRVSPYLADILKDRNQALIIVPTDQRAKDLAQDLAFFLPGRDIRTLYGEDGFFTWSEAEDRDIIINRTKVLQALSRGVPLLVVAPVSCAIKKLPPHSEYQVKNITFRVGEELRFSEIAVSLTNLGYERYPMVEGAGQFSVRGGLVDVFAPDMDDPIRIEFFGDEVESVRTFDRETQRSLENLREVTICPAEELTGTEDFLRAGVADLKREYYRRAAEFGRTEKDPDMAVILPDKIRQTANEIEERILEKRENSVLRHYLQYFYTDPEYIWDYLEEGSVIVLDDPDRMFESLELTDREKASDFTLNLERGTAVPRDKDSLSGTEDLLKLMKERDLTVFTPFPKRVRGIAGFDKVYDIRSRQPMSFEGKLNVMATEIASYLKRGYEVNIVSASEERLANLREFAEREDLKGINFLNGSLTRGIELSGDKKVWLTDTDIFGHPRRSKKKKSRTRGQMLSSFSGLSVGDYVVHENHGIGKFDGIHKLKVEGEIKDYIKIRYQGKDLLYVPVEQMDLVQKYIGNEDGEPRINRLSGGEWKATKQKARAAIAVMAEDLIELYASRQIKPGYAFPEDTPWQREFEEDFPFEETDDQLKATEEIKQDMESHLSMDRLLLGDVGFGKTEVAARAIFKCLAGGKQAAMLVPTTILANQHYYTLKERFEKYPFKVEVLSRFRTAAQQKTTVEKLARGEVDLVIGTHRLLSQDVRFKDLGLLVVDEEQRFGVDHKETIKKLKSNVDVLTLSATPIPRTLNMSLTGIKDVSFIEEPPEERYPVRTYVMEEDDSVVKEVIERELGRGGQVFCVYNRVRGLSRVAEKIRELVPDATVLTAHGQMNETALEDVMMKFMDRQADVLVSTSIIESGLDIQNANTMIILDSERYGLSQLYQMRGRVGRSTRLAYCYLMYKRDKSLTESQEKRLKAIREFTEFGAGFKVAMKDLEIRGAGNMLGTAQSGHIASIGYELYCKMVDNAVRALKGEIVTDDREESTMEFPVSAYIPDTYISDENLKLEMYKKISGVTSREDIEDLTDEFMDRFGDVPRETADLMKISYMRYMSEVIGIERIRVDKNDPQDLKISPMAARKLGNAKHIRKYILEFRPENGITAFAILNAKDKFREKFFANMGTRPFIRLRTEIGTDLDSVMELLEILVENKKAV